MSYTLRPYQQEAVAPCFQIVSKSNAKAIGLKMYFTGEPCSNGHVWLKYTSSSCCFICSKLKLKSSKIVLGDEERLARKKELQKVRGRNYYEKNKQLVKDKAKEWKKENPEKLRQSWVNWRKKETSKTINFMRDSLRRVLLTEKKGRTEEILGYSRNQLKVHIEKQFQKGMTWGNHGDWHIDHITPISALLSQGITNPKVINCLTNLKPIWAKENLSKSNKVEYLI